MVINLNIFLNKKILIYGLGKSGLSAFNFLKNKSDVLLFDDFQKSNISLNIKKKIISRKKLLELNFDQIILSPGIDINKCKLSKFLKKNEKKIFTDLDIFYTFCKNECITITGTNGKSTTSQLLYEVLSKQKIDVKLVGNIGNPILSIRNVKKKTIFIVEASSYQLEYSKLFRSKYAAIINLSPDHIERHGTIKKYIKAKFKLFKSQLKGNFAFVKKHDYLIKNHLKKNRYRGKIIKVDNKKTNIFLRNIKNEYFNSESNKENLSFVIEILKYFKIKKSILIKTIQKFKGLKYRQQIIFRNRSLTIINDSKSTSFSSSIGSLKTAHKIYWLLGGIPKKGDKFKLSKKYFNNISAFVYGKDKKFFNKALHGKIEYKNFNNLKNALKKIIFIIRKKILTHQIILFSPCAASFDNFKNFEDRGFYFNKLIKKNLNGIQKINL